MRFFALLTFLLGSHFAFAQESRQVMNRSLAWAGILAIYNFNPSWNVNLDVQSRYEHTDGDFFAHLYRPGVTWKAKNKIQLTAGIAFVQLYPNPNGLPARPEWRTWQEIGRQFYSKEKHHLFFPRFRLEQRFIKQYAGLELADEFSFHSLRERFRIDYVYNFTPANDKGFLLLGTDEYMINQIKGNTFFDQNRASVGMGYQINKNFTLQLTYMNLFFRKGQGQFEQHHIGRLTVVIQFAKKEKEKTQ